MTYKTMVIPAAGTNRINGSGRRGGNWQERPAGCPVRKKRKRKKALMTQKQPERKGKTNPSDGWPRGTKKVQPEPGGKMACE